ncbi:nicotinamide N-methyltransferase [Penicillium lagena]|uniref:nicotinamide N-methyltransferase n=1 Tax=Penicillium lagena TaxID=94218 RepID=UPI002540F404|nr:nicotinamide N-methyltransferase [Penicillium lagena]KAJ5601371.1 nicotinamide N-methyltransferase [Penicillium lagena]
MLQARLRPAPRPPTGDTSTPTRPDEDEPEDVFGAFLPHLFPDDAPSFHGDPGQHLLYASPAYGDLEIMVPTYPGESANRSEEIAAGLDQRMDGVNKYPVEEGRKLFAHFLWDSGMVVAEGVEDAAAGKAEAKMWNVDGERVLELGAGAALPSLISALSNAATVTATDHPSSPALSGAIAFNMTHNLRHISASLNTTAIVPHEWGVLSDPFSLANKAHFTRIIAADCYWMRSQHENLVRSMLWFLAPGGCIWVVANFHTGRAIVAGFFETAVSLGLEVERIYERDCLARGDDGAEVRREWAPIREGEGPGMRRRWCVVAVLRKKS